MLPVLRIINEKNMVRILVITEWVSMELTALVAKMITFLLLSM